MDSLSDLHSLWIGPRVTRLEQLCLASWLAHGHRAVVWAYQPIEGLPPGVDVRDARELLPEAAIVVHRLSGSASLFSNRFRYHLLRRHPVTWFDTDILLLRPLAIDTPYLFGWETADSICTAVLRLPSGSRALGDLIAYADARVPVPPWWPLKDRIRQRARGIVGRHERAEDLEWGSFGPRALTDALRRHRLTGRAQATEAFYPVHWDETALFYQPNDVLAARLTERTVAVHLWSTGSLIATPAMKPVRAAPPPAGSWIAAQCAAHGVDCGSAPPHH
jgi:hypothetical protein